MALSEMSGTVLPNTVWNTRRSSSGAWRIADGLARRRPRTARQSAGRRGPCRARHRPPVSVRGVACSSTWPTAEVLEEAARIGLRRGHDALIRSMASAMATVRARHLGVQQLHHAALDRDHALALVLRLVEGGDDLAREGDLGLGRREHLVGGRDLVGMDQRLAVEAEPAAVHALAAQAVGILEVVVDAVEHVEAVGARRRDGRRQPVERRAPVDRQIGARLLDEVVGAHDEAGEPRARLAGGGGDVGDVEDGKRRLDHRPQPRLVRRTGLGERLAWRARCRRRCRAWAAAPHRARQRRQRRGRPRPRACRAR